MESVFSTDLDDLISALDSSDSDDSIEEMATHVEGLLGTKVSKVPSQTAAKLCFDDDSTDSIEEMATNVEDELGLSNAEDETHHCPQCPNQYLHKSSLIFHMKIHNNNKRVKCEVCHIEIFTTKLEYDLHMLSHTGEKSYTCRICNRSFHLPDDLRKHKYKHLFEENEDESYKCPTDQYFQTPAKLSDHLSRHKKEKRNECSICHKKFIHRAQLKVHMHSHTNAKTFSRSESLKVHTRKNTVENPYKCELCDKRCSKSKLSSHQKNCARLMAKRKHLCPQCKKRYSHKPALNKHMKIHDKDATN